MFIYEWLHKACNFIVQNTAFEFIPILIIYFFQDQDFINVFVNDLLLNLYVTISCMFPFVKILTNADDTLIWGTTFQKWFLYRKLINCEFYIKTNYRVWISNSISLATMLRFSIYLFWRRYLYNYWKCI